MDAMILLMGAILLVIVVLGVVAFMIYRKEKRPVDYYSLFLMGILWMGIGIPLQNHFLSGLGIMFSLIGIFNKEKWKNDRDRWKHLSERDKKLNFYVMLILGIVILIGIILFAVFRDYIV